MSSIRELRGLSLVAGFLLLAGCRHDNWMMYGHDSSHSAHQPHEKTLGVAAAGTLNFTTTGWVFQSGGSFVASPTVYDETVYIGDGATGIFYAVHARGPNQGKVRWRYPPAVAPSPADACGTTAAPLPCRQRQSIWSRHCLERSHQRRSGWAHRGDLWRARSQLQWGRRTLVGARCTDWRVYLEVGCDCPNERKLQDWIFLSGHRA